MAKGTCSAEDCGTLVLARGWCSRHYQSWLRHGDPLATTREFLKSRTCAVADCGEQANGPGAARGWCRKHYIRWQAHGDPEAVASCIACGQPIIISGTAAYCMRRECRRQYRAATRAADPEKYRVAKALSRARQDKAKRRAAETRYKARADRRCVRPACAEFALLGYAYCRRHNAERAARRYARSRMRVPLRLYARQAGMCPDADHGGCGLPLGDADGKHVDHLIPLARGGPDDDWNLQLMHPKCNLAKMDRLVPAALAASVQHAVALIRPDGTLRRTMPAYRLP